MKNKKGFVMTETLVVVVFLVTIFTFIYVSIVPLIGKYEDMIYRQSDVDIVYKLYNIRKMLINDPNKSVITSGEFQRITCGGEGENEKSFTDQDYCRQLMQFLELNDYVLVYASNISNNLGHFDFVSDNMESNYELYDYAHDYLIDSTEDFLILLDNSNHSIAHLVYYK